MKSLGYLGRALADPIEKFKPIDLENPALLRRDSSGTTSTPLRLDIIVPLFNEEKVVDGFHAGLDQVAARLDALITIYYVNDGSRDATAEALREIAARDPRVAIVELSRNFGHQAALSAGLSGGRRHPDQQRHSR